MRNPLRISGALVLIVTLTTLVPKSSLSYANPQIEQGPVELAGSGGSTGVTVLQSNSSGLTFELVTDQFSIADDGTIKVDGLDYVFAEQGAPELPYYSTFVALPPDAEVAVRTMLSNVALESPLDVPPVPQDRLSGNASVDHDPLAYMAGSLHELTPLRTENPLIYGANSPYPVTSYAVSEPMYLRDLRLVELRLFPVRYNPQTKVLSQARSITADIRFLHTDSNLGVLSSADDAGGDVYGQVPIINDDQAQSWRSLPQTTEGTNLIGLPTGHEAFKIEVSQDGIYELVGSELIAQGMELPVDPATIQMMQRGQPVAFQFVDANANQVFDAVDKLRFYGWSFDGTRQDKMYVSANIFWLWTQGSGITIPTVGNQVGAGDTVTSFRESVTRWEKNDFSSGWSIKWDENEPTTWHTRPVPLEPGAIKSEAIAINLPNPDPNSTDGSYVVELTTRLRKPLSGSSTVSFEAVTSLNDSSRSGGRSWVGPKNLNISGTAEAGALKQPGEPGFPVNQINLRLSSNSPTPLDVLVTRVTVNYTRKLTAVNDYLSFSRKEIGPSTFNVSGFANGDSNEVFAWDISDMHLPKQIQLNPSDISGSSGNHTYTIGANHGADARYVVTTSENLLRVQSIQKYVPASITPPAGGAAWLGITHHSLRNAAESLAAYRSSLGMSAYAVDVEDVVNQVGYGFNTPETLRKYLRSAISNWNMAPQYVTLFGDATNNPRQLECPVCGDDWDNETPTLIVTDFVFVDRWQGMVPSDFALSLLFGNDLLADIAISRLPANTLAEANAMVQKVITYEMQRAGKNPPAWTKSLLFIADNRDNAGDFCLQNKTIEPLVGKAYNQTHLCLQEPTADNIISLRSDMRSEISDRGVSIANYRGHGSTTQWGGFNNEPAILSSDDADFWENAGRSVVLLSADCLDGYFILNGDSALGETFMRLNNRGSVAHWSSAGIGYSSEHSVLHRAFYEGMFQHNQNKIGDAVNFAKTRYYQAGRHPSELHSFVLLGDAAMTTVFQRIFMPIAYTP